MYSICIYVYSHLAHCTQCSAVKASSTCHSIRQHFKYIEENIWNIFIFKRTYRKAKRVFPVRLWPGVSANDWWVLKRQTMEFLIDVSTNVPASFSTSFQQLWNRCPCVGTHWQARDDYCGSPSYSHTPLLASDVASAPVFFAKLHFCSCASLVRNLI